LVGEAISTGLSTRHPQARCRNVASLTEPEQLDIFIPLQRSERLHEWARLAREEGLDTATPETVSTFAHWLQANGHAPAGYSHDSLEVLVAVMQDYERPASAPLQT
jgi:hypothetical protein